MWRCYLGDTMSGLLDRPIDLPSYSWSVDVGDCSLSTNRDKGAGTDEWSGITVPWSAIREGDAMARSSALSPSRRFLCLMWEEEGAEPVPVVWGAIGQRTDTWLDTSFSLDSVMGILSQRHLVREGVFGAVSGMTDVDVPDEWDPGKEGGYREGATVQHNGHEWRSLADDNHDEPGTSDKWEDVGEVRGPQQATFTRDAVELSGLSQRAAVCEIVRMCTEAKPGGTLPLDLPYLGERGSFSASYPAYDVQNNRASDLVEQIASLDGGPDVQFRPYMADSQHVRVRLEAGSDGDVYLGQGAVHTLTCFPGGGTVQNLTVDHLGPTMRVYATGSGTDEMTICHLAEDLALCTTSDPWPLVECAYSDRDSDSGGMLSGHADAQLAALGQPVIQIRGDVDLADPRVPSPGSIWPGELVDLAIDGFPTLPDGVYRCRLMEMSGDQSTVARLTFDVMRDPVYGG